jgi:hypothetical protein
MCRSGHRRAKTVEKLARAGFKNVDNLTDGFGGGKVKDKNHPNYGKHTKNSRRHAGVPWTRFHSLWFVIP